LQSTLCGIRFIGWLWIAIGLLPLFLGSLMATLKLSDENNQTSPQEQSS